MLPKLKLSPTAYLNVFLGVALCLALFIIGLLFTKTKKNEEKIAEAYDRIAKQEEIIKLSELLHKEELRKRKELRKEDSITILQLKELKAKDSINHVKDVASLKIKYSTFTPTELDQELLTRMDTLPPGSSPVSLDLSFDRSVKEWCLAVHDQNQELWQSLEIKNQIITKQDTLITSQREQIASFTRSEELYKTQITAYREEKEVMGTIIKQQDKIITKTRTERTLVGGIAVAIITLLILK